MGGRLSLTFFVERLVNRYIRDGRPDGTSFGDGTHYSGVFAEEPGGGGGFAIASFVDIKGVLNNTLGVTIKAAMTK